MMMRIKIFGSLEKRLYRRLLFHSVRKLQKVSTQDSNVVPHRSTNWARRCLTSLSEREAVFSSLYGRLWELQVSTCNYDTTQFGILLYLQWNKCCNDNNDYLYGFFSCLCFKRYYFIVDIEMDNTYFQSISFRWIIISILFLSCKYYWSNHGGRVV